MRLPKRTAPVAVVVAVAVAGIIVAAVAAAGSRDPSDLTNVASPNPKAVGVNAPNVLSPELQEVTWAQGSWPLDGATAAFPDYGYDGNGPQMPAFGSNVE